MESTQATVPLEAAGESRIALGPQPLSPAEQAWRAQQARRLAWCRTGFLVGVGTLLALAPWESWSSHWFWYLGLVLTGGCTLALPWFGGTFNFRALKRHWCWGLLVFALAVLISWPLSRDPHLSGRYLRKEFLFYAVGMVGVVLAVTDRRHLRALVMVLALSGLLACAMGIIAYHFYLYGADEITRLQWRDEKIVRHDVPTDPGTLRAQFPLEHHTLLGYFAALLTLLLVYLGVTGARRPWLWWVATAIPLWTLLLTLNRGGMLGLLFATLAVALLANWRIGLALIAVVALCVVLVVPPQTRGHYLSAFNWQTYRDESSSMVYRFRGWRGALAMIRDHPLTGIGYSWKNFEETYPRYAGPDEVEMKPHAHNIWLEVAAECGVPAAVGFAVFQIGLLVASMRAWLRRGRRLSDLAVLIALQLLILVVGMISYYMRRQMGLVTWLIFAFALVTLDLERRRQASEQERAA